MNKDSYEKSHLMNRNEEEEFDPETEKEESVIKGDSEYDLAMKLPLKLHIFKLEDTLQQLFQDIEESKQNIEFLHTAYFNLTTQMNSSFSALGTFTLDESRRLVKQLRDISQQENEETRVLRTQINQLTQDKIKLQQNTLILENRVCETEKDLGFRKN